MRDLWCLAWPGPRVWLLGWNEKSAHQGPCLYGILCYYWEVYILYEYSNQRLRWIHWFLSFCRLSQYSEWVAKKISSYKAHTGDKAAWRASQADRNRAYVIIYYKTENSSFWRGTCCEWLRVLLRGKDKLLQEPKLCVLIDCRKLRTWLQSSTRN